MLKVNKQFLENKPGKDYAEIVFFGDLHWGHPTCLEDEAKAMLTYCLDNRVYVLLMGDLIEAGLTGSVGDSVYAQNLDPQEQMDGIIELLKPLAKAGLIIGLHTGNHESRIYKTSGIDVAKIVAQILGVRYLHSAFWSVLTVGKINYTVYSMHGASGSKFVYTKIKAITDISHYFDADVVAMGHVHDIASNAVERQRIDMRTKAIEYYKQYTILTGHYLGYNLSYAQMKGFPPSKIGSPKIRLNALHKDVHISL